MSDYPYGYCGMTCALCTRHRTDGVSRCEGCSADGYYTDACKVFRCCRDRGLPICAECGEFPCARLVKMGDFSNLSTDHVKERVCAEVKQNGFDAWYADYKKRAELLTLALLKYNNGRMKRYICELFIQRDMSFLENVMQLAEGLKGDKKELGAGFRGIVEREAAAHDTSIS